MSDLYERAKEIDPYDFLHEISDVIHPPEDQDDPEEWINQFKTLMEVENEYEYPAMSIFDELVDTDPEDYFDQEDVGKVFRQKGYLVGINTTIHQTRYWSLSLALDKLEGYERCVSEDELEVVEEMKSDLQDIILEASFFMWKNAISHLLFMHHDSFIHTENSYRFVDYHEKLHINFITITASTLIETTLERILLDNGVGSASKKRFATKIDMVGARTSMTDTQKERLHGLREVRNGIAHNIINRTDFRFISEIDKVEDFFDATFVLTYESLNIMSEILEEEYGHDELFKPFHQDALDLANTIKRELDKTGR